MRGKWFETRAIAGVDRPVIYGLIGTVLLATSAQAEHVPGPVDPEIVGEWSCGRTMIEITHFGSIDLSGEDARTGVIRAGEGMLVIIWGSGSRSDWSYAAGDGALILGTDRGANYACLDAH
jgi:hypothetical protein